MFSSIPNIVSHGHRRHRFMESSDFNSAARQIFDALRQALHTGRLAGPLYMSFEMDPATPGGVIGIRTVAIDRPDIEAAIAEHGETAQAAVDVALRHLLAEGAPEASLVAFVSPAKAPPDAFGVKSPGPRSVEVELRSVDLAASTAFRLRGVAKSSAGRLQFRALNFRRLPSAA